jgi:hypothetical protein
VIINEVFAMAKRPETIAMQISNKLRTPKNLPISYPPFKDKLILRTRKEANFFMKIYTS